MGAPCQAEPPALLSQNMAPARGYSPTLWPVLLEVSKRSALISEMRAQVGTCCMCSRYGSMGSPAPRVTPWAQLLPAGWQGPRAGLPAPWPSWPRACPCQDMLCPGRSLAEPVPHHTGSPGAIGSAVGPWQGQSSQQFNPPSLPTHSMLMSPGGASTGPTISVVLHIVEVNPPLPPVLLQQVALGATQVNPAALRQEKGWQGCAHVPTTSTPCPVGRLHSTRPPRTSSQFCSSFTQNLARWKLPLSVRSGEGNRGLLTLLLSA